MCTHECKKIAKCTHVFFSKLHFSEYSSRRRTLSWGGEQYGGQGFVVVAARGWPKLKFSDLNQEPTEKKASWLGTWYGEFSSSWYPIRYPFSDFLIQPELKVWGSWYFCFRPNNPLQTNKQMTHLFAYQFLEIDQSSTLSFIHISTHHKNLSSLVSQ